MWCDLLKSTYCKLMAKYAESRGRKMRIVNLDPTPGDLVFEHPIADIRDVVKEGDVKDAEQSAPETGAGFELVLGYTNNLIKHLIILKAHLKTNSKNPINPFYSYILENPDWLFGALGESKDNDYILFDCPGVLVKFHLKLYPI